jgi:1-deoxy-D-xylulose-5-phosphate reductoisomerase
VGQRIYTYFRNVSTEKKKIAILGSTGSIGTQALEVIAGQAETLQVEVLTAQNNADLLIQQAIAFKPNAVVIGDPSKYSHVKESLWSHDIKVYSGAESLCQIVESTEVDMVLTALVGFAGLQPTLRAIEAGKPIALANKETLVVAGEMVTNLAKKKAVNILPVDSEHSAIFQCMAGEWSNPIEKIFLTASGGPFRGRKREELANVTREQALKHPNWSMGAKITIDSATMMNKGLEVIEAKWLFHLKPSQIDIVVHPQSIIHSIVQFEDGSMKAQMGLPDMKLPIQYALGYPLRLKSDFPRFDFANFRSLTFEEPDAEAFPCWKLAFDALESGGNAPCILNAANEIAVEFFLKDKITFLQIPDLLSGALAHIKHVKSPDLSDLLATDLETREWVRAAV